MDKNKARHEIEKVLAIQDDVDFADALMELIDPSEDEDYDQLPAPLKMVVALNAFSLETSSGGLYQLIANTEPAVLDDIRAGLRLIVAQEAARILDEIRGRFPEDSFPEDPQERFKILNQLDSTSGGKAFRKIDKAYEATGENMLALLKAYVARQKDEMSAALATWKR